MKIGWKINVVAMAGLLWIGQTSFAQDQEQAAPRQPSSPKARKYTIEEEYVVVGKIAKPQVQFLISREKGSSEEALVLKESFLPKILKAVESPPF